MRRLLLIGLMLIAGLTGCAQPTGVPGQSCVPKEAFKMWRAAPDRVYILDVRTPAEFIFIGHAPMARNIPVKFLANRWDAEKKKPAMRLNPDFIAEVKKAYQPDDTILVMCGSGLRGAEAAKLMKEAGFADVLNIEGGFEGERGEGCSDHGAGKLIKPGWKNSGLLWTYAIDPEYLYTKD